MGENGLETGREVSHLIVAGLNEASESQETWRAEALREQEGAS